MYVISNELIKFNVNLYSYNIPRPLFYLNQRGPTVTHETGLSRENT